MHDARLLFWRRKLIFQLEIVVCVEVSEVSSELNVLSNVVENPLCVVIRHEIADAIGGSRLMTVSQWPFQPLSILCVLNGIENPFYALGVLSNRSFSGYIKTPMERF